jgi:integrase
MRGSISPGKLPGTWYLRVEMPIAADGKRNRRREAFRGTKAEAQRRLREVLRDVESGGLSAERLTVADIAGRWLTAIEHRVGTRTYLRYRQIVRDFVVADVGSLRLDALRPAHVESALATWRQRTSEATSRPLSQRSIAHAFMTLKAMCRWAVRMSLLSRNPCEAVMPPRWEQREMKTLDPQGAAKLLAAARGTELEIPIIVMLGTGLRRGEAFGLRWSDIDFKETRLTVRRSIEVIDSKRREKSPKTARSKRTLALAPFVVGAFLRQKQAQQERCAALGLPWDDTAYVFDLPDGTPWNPDQFSWRFADLVRRFGLPEVRLHDLRHSYATIALAAGTDLKTISTSLGHSTIAITANVYAHVTESLHRENAARVDAVLGGVVDQATAPVSTVACDRVTASHGGPGPLAAHLQPIKTKKPCNSKVFMVAPTGFELLTSGSSRFPFIPESLIP